MEFDRKGYKLLTEEIADEGDELALQIIVFGECQQSDDEDDVEDKVIGIATVNLWFMIEDSCAIVLQVSCVRNFYYFSSGYKNAIIYSGGGCDGCGQ